MVQKYGCFNYISSKLAKTFMVGPGLSKWPLFIKYIVEYSRVKSYVRNILKQAHE